MTCRYSAERIPVECNEYERFVKGLGKGIKV